MIKIVRGECPEALKDTPSKGTYYNKRKVVKKLWDMQREKCCYCEQKIPAEGHSKAVEHFRPKSVFKYLKNDWKNLLLACALCNGKKSDKFPVELTNASGEAKVLYLKTGLNGKAMIIDPSDPNIDPEEHIGFIVDDVNDDAGRPYAKNNSELGKITIREVGLDKPFLTQKRYIFFTRVLLPYYNTLLDARAQNNTSLLQSYKDRLSLLLSSNSEFTAFARSFAMLKKLDSRFEIRISIGAED